jgi:putative sterol carrier protein
MSELSQAVASFAAAYHARPELLDEQRGWTRTVLLVASDCGEQIAVRIEDGRIVSWSAPQGSGDVVITADAAILRDILELRMEPNQPYVFGELTVQGSESDFLRLDYITARLCPN